MKRRRSVRGAAKSAGRGSAPARTLALGRLDRHLGYLLRRLQLWVFQDFIETLRPLKVRPAQYSVLLVISANPGRSQAAIGHRLGIERARLARMLHELERRKWVDAPCQRQRCALAFALSHAGWRAGFGQDHASGAAARGAACRPRRPQAPQGIDGAAARIRLITDNPLGLQR